MTGIQFKRFSDLCPLNPKWNQYTWADHLATEWPPLVFVNPPFTKCPEFNFKALQQYKRGCNIVMLVTESSYTTKEFKEYSAGIVKEIMKPDSIKFVGHGSRLGTNVVIYGLFQPDFLRRMDGENKKRSRPGPQPTKLINERFLLEVRYGAPVQVAAKKWGIGKSKAYELKKSDDTKK